MPKAGRYRIARKIADGGMAEIFLGTQHGMEGFERPGVLKRILAPLVADPQFRNMLIDEAHVAMGLNHSNIVQVLDLGHVRGRYFLVMELVDGWDLNQILTRAKAANFPIPPEILLYITAEVCRALAYAHGRTREGQPLAIVHRDISPHNVLISEQGEVKLTDFGIAKAMGRREHTSQGVIKGKLAFMSPEQASGRDLDQRSDLFSVGTMLYLFFTGRKPFESPTDLEAIVRVRECRFTPPEGVQPELDPALVKLIKQAMSAAPADRYQSAEQLLVDIETLQRTSYKPSGQTELKRWLADLQQRDQCPTTSHTASPQAAMTITEDLDVGEGAEVVFDESVPIDIADILRGMQPTIATGPEPSPEPRASSEARTTTGEPPGARDHRVSRRLIVFGILVAALAGTAWLAIPHGTDQDGKRAHHHSPPVDAHRAATPAALDAGARLAVDTGVTGVQAPSGTAASPPPPTATAESEEEEDLLKNKEPDDNKRVLGEDEGIAGGVGVKPSPQAVVSVHVVSVPAGAVVSLGKRVFGRAPMNLRFRPGLIFELTFVKKGYLPANKRFAATSKKNQVVKITLKKKPEPKRSIFRRIFGQ